MNAKDNRFYREPPAASASSDAIKTLDMLIAWMGEGQRKAQHRPIDLMPRELEQRIYALRQSFVPSATGGKPE